RAAIGLEPGFDPVQRLAVTLRALATVAELGQALDGGLVPLQVELTDERGDRVRRLTRRGLLGNGHGPRAASEHGDETQTGGCMNRGDGHVETYWVREEGACRVHDEHKRWLVIGHTSRALISRAASACLSASDRTMSLPADWPCVDE